MTPHLDERHYEWSGEGTCDRLLVGSLGALAVVVDARARAVVAPTGFARSR